MLNVANLGEKAFTSFQHYRTHPKQSLDIFTTFGTRHNALELKENQLILPIANNVETKDISLIFSAFFCRPLYFPDQTPIEIIFPPLKYLETKRDTFSKLKLIRKMMRLCITIWHIIQ